MTTALIYHDVLPDGGPDDSGFAGADALSYKLTETQFRRHLELIASVLHPGTPVRAYEPGAAVGGTRAVVLTFDDGGASAATRILPALRARAWQAHFFVTTNFIGAPGFLSASGLRELHTAGQLVGSHSASHPARMSSLSPDALRGEWRDSRRRLEDVLGAPVNAASVPGGYYSAAVARTAAEAGFRVLFTSEPRRSVSVTDGIAVVGRFSVTRRTSEAHVISLASGHLRAAMQQRVAWGVKKVAKRLGGKAWLAARRKVFDLRSR